MQCLLDILRGQAFDRAIDQAEWEVVFALAEEESVLPWVAASLRARQGDLPPAILSRLETIERDAALAAFYWSSELKGVLRAFGQSSLCVVLLKGPSLAERLYGERSLRVSRDLDLLVSRADLPRAESILAAIGFVAAPYPDDYHRAWYRGTTTVELHHDVENPLAFDFDVASALRQAHSSVFQGQPCRLLVPEDELVFLCVHAVRHRFERLSLIVDLQLAFEKLAGNAEEWRFRQEVAGLSGVITLGLAMARRLQPKMRVPELFREMEGSDRHLERLADRLWNRLLSQVSEALDWRSVHAFYVEMERPGSPRLRRRVRHLWILVGRVIQPDYAFAAQFGMHRGWQAWMLRPLRLLSQLVRRRASND